MLQLVSVLYGDCSAWLYVVLHSYSNTCSWQMLQLVSVLYSDCSAWLYVVLLSYSAGDWSHPTDSRLTSYSTPSLPEFSSLTPTALNPSISSPFLLKPGVYVRQIETTRGTSSWCVMQCRLMCMATVYKCSYWYEQQRYVYSRVERILKGPQAMNGILHLSGNISLYFNNHQATFVSLCHQLEFI